jgi:hypothetical protein
MLVVRLYVIRVWLLLKRLPLTSNISMYFESNASLCLRQTTCVSQSRHSLTLVYHPRSQLFWKLLQSKNLLREACQESLIPHRRILNILVMIPTVKSGSTHHESSMSSGVEVSNGLGTSTGPLSCLKYLERSGRRSLLAQHWSAAWLVTADAPAQGRHRSVSPVPVFLR